MKKKIDRNRSGIQIFVIIGVLLTVFPVIKSQNFDFNDDRGGLGYGRRGLGGIFRGYGYDRDFDGNNDGRYRGFGFRRYNDNDGFFGRYRGLGSYGDRNGIYDRDFGYGDNDGYFRRPRRFYRPRYRPYGFGYGDDGGYFGGYRGFYGDRYDPFDLDFDYGDGFYGRYRGHRRFYRRPFLRNYLRPYGFRRRFYRRRFRPFGFGTY